MPTSCAAPCKFREEPEALLFPVETQEAALPAGHYSQAVVANGFVFVSSLLPVGPNPERFLPDGAAEQTKALLRNLRAILQAVGSDFKHLAQVQLLVADVADLPVINAVYQDTMKDCKPARAMIPCGPMGNGVLVKLTAVATLS